MASAENRSRSTKRLLTKPIANHPYGLCRIESKSATAVSQFQFQTTCMVFVGKACSTAEVIQNQFQNQDLPCKLHVAKFQITLIASVENRAHSSNHTYGFRLKKKRDVRLC